MQNLPSQPLYMPGLTHHGYTPKPPGTRILDQCLTIYVFKNILKMPALPQLGLPPPCPAAGVVSISNIHDVWTSSTWLTCTLTLLKNFYVCPPAVQVRRRDERFFFPEILKNWKQTIATEYLLCQDLFCPILSFNLLILVTSFFNRIRSIGNFFKWLLCWSDRLQLLKYDT